MKEFSSMKEATRILKNSHSPLYTDFLLSAGETTRYMSVMDRIVKLAEECGVNDKRHDGLAAGGMMLGSGAVLIGIFTLNPFAIAAGAATVAKGAAIAQQSETHDKRMHEGMLRAIKADSRLCRDLETIVEFHTAVHEHVKRVAAKTPPPPGQEYVLTLPPVKYLQYVNLRSGGEIDIKVYENQHGYTAADHPERLPFKIHLSRISYME